MADRGIDLSAHAQAVLSRGYTIIPQQVSGHALAALNRAADRAIKAVDDLMATGARPAHTEINPHYRAARCFYSWDAACRQLLTHDTVYELGRALLDGPRLWDMTVLEARPLPVGGDLGSFDWHRDFPITVDTESGSQSYLWVFTCLTDVTADNGATWVIPGSHRDDSVQVSRHGAAGASRPANAVQLTARAGDLVAINPAMLHAVGENRTPENRRLALVGMCSASRRPLLNHSAISRPIPASEMSERARHLVRPTGATLDATWDVLPEGWPRASAQSAPGSLWRRLAGSFGRA